MHSDNMHFTLREEIIIYTGIFVCSLLIIPVVLLSASLKHPDVHNLVTIADLKLRQKILDNFFEIIETKRLQTKEANFSGLSIFRNFTMTDFEEFSSSPKKLPRKYLRNLWKKRDKSVVTKVRNQYKCGNCYALAVIETIESMHAIRTGNLKEFSVQQMLDCNDSEMGCNGGDSCRLLSWLLTTQTIVQSNDDYKSSKSLEKCESVKETSTKIKVKDYLCDDFTNREELLLLYLAYKGPLIASVNALPLRNYKSGIVQNYKSNKSAKILNHAVQIIGYDLSGDSPFYIVKNSWGKSFGLSGYLNIAIGGNICGIAQRISAIIL
ncbi:CLUMA_CG011022, isoform A [Clunio marinus]|uniref:CLUMA_CG011022, isoform A n=1 Tax=Clunio marinus TaxID=568069 RepID=A0A1J1IBI8_9DIPT|nr:CLUMA_CG011022, isoform A [Clunio marinus]